MDIGECLEKGFLKKVDSDETLIKKELAESNYDLERAEKAFEKKDFKWCIIQSYYSMFHSARAILFKIGYREKRHFVISVVLEDLNKKGMLESKFVNYFNAGLSSREEADYHYAYSEETAKHILDIAKEFSERLKILLKEL
ncbi:HEPN domain-containing protein [Candidatus Woesearchaeota archaeon]|nr:HEPN domain-containing protein [Candidatus Woesearchaeota archaeon]